MDNSLTETAYKGYILAALDAAEVPDALQARIMDALSAAMENMTPAEAEDYARSR